ncbi:unnamed protein product, partial [Nesidiocoris tenuis]
MSSVRSAIAPMYTISADRTVRQRDFLQHVRSELKTRSEKGEPNLTIKFISGIPRIVTSYPAGPEKSSKNAWDPLPAPLNLASPFHSSTIPSPSSSILSIFYQNVRGINTKLDSLRHQAAHLTFDLLVFTETWLSEQVASAELRLSNYHIFRTDRSPTNNKAKCGPGGGVLIAISNKFSSYQWTPDEDILEHAVVIMPEFRLIVSSIYLPSYQPTDHLEAYINQLESVSLKHPGFNLIAI